MDDDPGPSWSKWAAVLAAIAGLAVLSAVAPGIGGVSGGDAHAAYPDADGPAVPAPWTAYLPPWVLAAVGILLGFSAFFSGSETAFFSIHRIRLRAMREGDSLSARLVAGMMDSPGRLLTTVLVGNMTVNVLIGVLLGHRVEEMFEGALGVPKAAAYAAAVVICTSLLVLIGEITPKVIAVQMGERLARVSVIPLLGLGKLLAPVCNALLRITDAIFAVTRFHELRAAPFITDEELRAVLSDGDSPSGIERGGRRMIRSILDFTEANLREILTPRPDVIAIPAEATIQEAVATYRAHEYSRMPVYREDLDHIEGVLVMKDLLPSVAKGDLSAEISRFMRPPLFVPETMTIAQFVRSAQQHRSHLAVVVDEYGGAAGIVTLEDAIEEVVGDIMDEGEQETPLHERLDERVYRVDGSLSLDELNDMLGIALEDEEHETLAGFLMAQSDKVLEPGDRVVHSGVVFVVERCAGKRAETVRVELPPEIGVPEPGDEEDRP